MTYPSGLDTFDRKNPTDPLSDGHAELHNDISTAVEAIETELGTNPSGAEATVAARLTAGESATSGAQSTADAAIPKATLDAQTVLAAVADNTPVALSVTEQTLVGRKTGGDVAALSASEAKTLLAIANTDVSGLGTASTKNVAVSGDAASGEVVKGSDSRLSDARTPSSTLAHASSHASAGSDPVTLSASQITGTAVVTNDSRLSDARTPTAHAASHGTGQSDAITIAAAQVTGTALVASTATAKGDLYVATAADTVNRLAVGADGKSLYADSSTSTGVAWQTPHPTVEVGSWVNSGVNAGSHAFPTAQGSLYYYPWPCPVKMTISDFSIRVTATVNAGNVLRFGFWLLDGANGIPGTLIADMGTIDASTTGAKTISSLSVALPFGRIALGVALQGTGTGAGTATASTSSWSNVTAASFSLPTDNGWYRSSGETGAFGGTATVTSTASIGLMPGFAIKRSA